jgi:large repetitive protein
MQLNPVSSAANVASLLPDQGQGIPSSKLVYDDAVDTTEINQVLFIDSNVKNFQTYANARTFPIIYDRICTREQMLEVLSKKFTSISRIAFVNHFSETHYFLNQESLFSEANKQFVVDIITQFHVSNVDYLACSTLSSIKWTTYYSELQTASTSVMIGASDNNTGNIKYGGDWILESTHEDIRAVYFNDQIRNYASLLDTITIDGLTYSMDGTNASVVGWVSGTDITIPPTITDGTNTYNVTSIASSAFANCSALISIVIPESVTSIGVGAFFYCTSLIGVTIPSSCTIIDVISFAQCWSLSSFIFASPSACTTIAAYALTGCTSLLSIDLPNTLTTIDQQGLAGCGFISIVIPSSVTSIGINGIFANNSMISTYFLGSSIPTISPDAFLLVDDRPPMNTAYYLDSATNVSNFDAVTFLVAKIPLSLADLYSAAGVPVPVPPPPPNMPFAFPPAVADQSIIVDGFNYDASNVSVTDYKYKLSTDGGATYGSPISFNGTAVGPFIITGLDNGITYNVAIAAEHAGGLSPYFNCPPRTPTNIGLPSTPIITSVIGGDQTITIAYTADGNGSVISRYRYMVSTDNGIIWTPLGAYLNRDVVPPVPIITNPLVFTKFNPVSGPVQVPIVNGTTYLFKMESLNAVTFSRMSNVVSVTPTAAAAPEPTAPAAPTITSITAGDQSATINFTANSDNGSAISNYKYSTDNGANWTTLSPESTSSPIVVSGLTNDQVYQVKLIAINNIGAGAASASTPVTPVAPPAVLNYNYNSGDLTASVSGWVSGTSVTIPSTITTDGITYNVTNIAGYGFASASITSVTIPNGVTSIDSRAFMNCTNLISVTFPTSGLTSIGQYAFSGCSSLTSITIPTGLTTIQNSTFVDCGSLTSVTLPTSVTTIEIAAFMGCGSLSSINLPNEITTMGGSVFNGCSNLSSVKIPSGVTYLDGTFDGCSFTYIIIPSTIITIGAWTFPFNSLIHVYFMGNAIPNILSANFFNAVDTAYYLNSATNTSVLNSNFTTLVPLSSADLLAAATAAEAPPSAATAPAAPTITSITAGDQSASVAFTAGSDNGSAISNYKYSRDNGYSWTILDPLTTTSPIIIPNLTNGQTYQVKLMAINNIGEGAASDSTSVTPVGAPETPTIIELVADDQSVTINFTDGADNGSAILSYQYSKDNGTNWTTLDASAVYFIQDAPGVGHRTINVSNLTNGQVYQVKLKATNAEGTSAATEAQSVTPVAAPAAPAITSITPGNATATINFTDGADNGSAITSYQYSIDNGESWTTLDASAVESSTIYVSNLTNGQLYNIKLRAVNIIGTSEETASQSVTPVAEPAKPTIIDIAAGDQSATINFTDGFNNGSAITSYQYSITNGESWVTLDPLEVDTLLDASSVEYRAIYVSNLTNGDTYYVKIKATNTQGSSEETSTQSVTPVAAPAAPTITNVTAGDQSLIVAFTANSANGSAITNYQYSTDNGTIWTILDPSSTISPIVIPNITNGQTYQVKLKAMNAQGASVESSAQSGMPVAAPAAPTITSITAGDTSATINFTSGSSNGSAITNYQYSTNNGESWITQDPSSTISPIVVSGLTNGQTYQVKLIAINNIGAGAASDSTPVTPVAAPAAPTITSITAGNQSASIAFTAGETNGSDILNYKYSCLLAGQEDIWTTLDTASTSSPILISSLVNGETYQVKIKAVSAAGESPESNALSVKPIFKPTAPTITEVLAGDQSASITFTAGETNGSDITNYQYSATTSGEAVWITLDPKTTTSPIPISSLANGETYFIKLRAVNEVGAGETSTNTKQVKPVAAPVAPTILSITGRDHNVSISYTAGSDNGSAITSYQYSCSLDGSVNWIAIDASAAATPIVVSGLTNGQTYQVKLKAINTIGESTESNELSGMPVAAPDAPTITSITAGNHSASIVFTANANNGSAISNYQYSTDNGSSWITIDPSSTISPIVASGLINGQTYQVKIKAVNGIGSSVASSAESVIPVAAPASPTIVRVDEGDHSLIIVYTANENNGSDITSYQYSINDGVNWTILDVSAAASPIVVSNLSNGQTYQVKLNAANVIGVSETLPSISVIPSTNPVAPIITDITSGDQTASIAFTAGDANGAAITNYKYSTDNGANWTPLSPAATSSPISLTELENGKAYSIKLKALNRKGLSDESNALSVTPAGAPISPNIYNIIAGDGSAIVNFTAGFNNGSALTNYQYSKNNGTSWTPLDPSATISPITISNLTNGQTYPVKIKAVNAKGVSIESNVLSVTPIAPPAAPTITTASVGDSTATFTITANATNGSAIYNYKYSFDNGDNWTDRSPVSTASSLVLTELENGKTYTIIVKAVNTAGDSVASSPAQSVTPAGLPFAPTIDTAIAGDRSVTINFSAHFNNGSAITAYKHAYSSNSGSTWSAWTQRSAGTSESPLVISGLTNGQSYLVKIRAVNAKGDSADSNQSSSVMPIAAPDAPTLTGVTTTDSAITINFSANASNGSAITNYMYSLDNGVHWTERSPAATTTSIVVLELENGASYSVKLIAINAAGNSVASNVITVILAGPPDAPTITGVTGGDRSINVAFHANADNDSPITTYQHSYSSNSGSTWSAWTQRSTGTTASPLLISGLINAQTYLVKLKAVNALGASVESSQSSPVMAVAAPEAPSITGVVAGDRSVSIAFDPSFNNGSAITSYQYSYTSNSGSSWSAWTTLGESATSPLVATGLTNGQTYQVKLKAVNAVGAGAESVQSSSFKPVSVPAKPIITGVTTGALSVSIAFTAGFDNGSDITNYEYAYSSNGGSSWSDWNARSAGTTASPLIATGLLNGTTYVLKIRAVNAIGSGADSDQSSSVKPVDVPAAPTITGEITAGDRGATIAFTAGFDNGLTITTYQYSYSSDSGNTWSAWAIRNLGSTASPLIVSGLLNGTTYSMKIRAVNALGGGIESSAKQVMPISEPAAPTITGVAAAPTSVKIALTAGFNNGSAITSYQFQSSINSGTSWSEWGTCSSGESASQVIATGLLNGTAYVVRIRAVNAIGSGAVSEQSSSVTPVDTPSAPTILNTSTTGDKIITIMFTPPSTNNGLAITNYRYSTNNGVDWTERSPSNLTSTIVITSALANGTSTALANGTIYPVIIAAKNSLGYGTSSEIMNMKPKSAPGKPTITSINAANAKAIINFTGAFDNGADISNYKYSTDAGKTWNTLLPKVTSSPIVVTTGLTNGKLYSVKILAINSIGLGVASDAVPVTPVPGVPFAPTISTIVGGNNSATINVVAGDTNGSAITNYRYSVDGVWTTLSPAVPSPKTILVPGLTNGQSYTITLKALNVVGEGSESLPKSVVPAGPPFAPTITSITRGNASAIINFDPSYNNGSAIVNYKYSTAVGKWITLKIPPTNNQILVTGLTNATTYSMQIAAISERWPTGGAVSNAMSVIPAGAPALPKISKITAGDSKVNLTFTAGVNNGSAILSYQYAYTSDSGVNWSTWTPSSWTTGDTSMNIVGLTNGTPYSVKLRAINAVGEGVESVASLAVRPFGAPYAPTITSIVRGNTSALVYFDASGSNGSPINKYSYSLDNGAWKASTYKVGDAAISITALKNGQTYSIRIRALSVAFIAGGEPSNALSVTPATLAVAPKITTIVGGDHSATINFTAGANNGSAITNYMYSLDGSTNWVTLDPASTTSPIVVQNLTNGQAYPIKLKAINDVGVSLLSNAVPPVTPAGPPTAPTINSETSVRGDKSLTINFTAGNGNGVNIAGYVCSYSSDSGATWTRVAITSVPTPSTISLTKLTNGTTYSVKLQATSSRYLAGGDYSNIVSIKPAGVPALPSIPAVGGVTIGNQTATITFNSVDANGSPITNYQYLMNTGLTWTDVSGTWISINASDVLNNTIVLSGLTNAIKYNLKLKATNDVGNSLPSSAVSFTPDIVSGAPSISSVSVSKGLVSIVFVAPVVNNGTAVVNYAYAYSSDDGATWTTTTPAIKSIKSPIVTTKLLAGTYSIKIMAINGRGASEDSNIKTIVVV